VPTGNVAFRRLDGAQAAGHSAELRDLHAEVYAGPPYQGQEDAGEIARRLRVWCRQPGFALAQARSGGFLIGYAAGMPLRPATSWWRYLTTALPDDITTEHPGRTFALTDLLVRAAWRQQGIGRELHDLILASRGEERATLTVLPAAASAQRAFQSWGWQKVARARGPEPGGTVSDVLVLALPVAAPPSR
jgi:ribosomal protein S18 acetylase RimI-like enzyme